jgi:poly-beta-1,6-N-acetyl-D-glucosamine synthase
MTYVFAAAFAGSAIFVLYILIGYPLLLSALARRKPQTIEKRFEPKTVTVLMAVRNGQDWIEAKLRSILALNYPRELMQILVLSDGSNDRTEELAAGFAADRVEVVRLPRSGKAAALNAGMQRARGEILFFTDVRQPLDPNCLRSLVSSLGDPSVGSACGHVLFLGEGEEGVHTGMYWRYEKWIRRNLTRAGSLLAGTGCIYALRRDLAVSVPANTLLDDSYLPLGAFFRGYRFVLDDDAIAYEYPNSLDSEFRRKVRTLAGIYQLVGFYPALLNPFRWMGFHFISYKLGRLLLPHALLIAAASSFGLPGILAPIALGAQGLFYGLAALDLTLPQGSRAKRLTSPARTFVVLMAASFCAMSIFFVPPSRLWKETTVAAASGSQQG